MNGPKIHVSFLEASQHWSRYGYDASAFKEALKIVFDDKQGWGRLDTAFLCRIATALEHLVIALDPVEQKKVLDKQARIEQIEQKMKLVEPLHQMLERAAKPKIEAWYTRLGPLHAACRNKLNRETYFDLRKHLIYNLPDNWVPSHDAFAEALSHLLSELELPDRLSKDGTKMQARYLKWKTGTNSPARTGD